MSASLTLEQARIKLNMPFASETEVVAAAKKAGIEINLTGIQNNANLNDLNNKLGGSLFGAKTQQPQAKQPTQKFSLNQTNLTFGDKSNYQVSTNVKLSSTGSIFGSLDNTKTKGLDTTFNQNVSGNIAQSGFGQELKKPSLLDSFLSSTMASFRGVKDQSVIFADENEDIDMSKVVSQEFIEGGKIRYTKEDGSVVEKQLSEATLKKTGGERKLSKIEYVDGNAVYYDLNGNKIENRTRKAFFGERGYVKDGNGIDEDLVSILGQDRIDSLRDKQQEAMGNLAEINTAMAKLSDDKIAQIAETNPEQAEKLKKDKAKLEKQKNKIEQKMFKAEEALVSDYIKKVYKECDGDTKKIKAKINNLIKNSDMNTEASQQMVHILGAFVEKTKDMSKEEIASFLTSAMDASTGRATDNVEAMVKVITFQQGEKGKTVLGGFTIAAKDTGNEKVASDALIQNIGNTQDAETGNVDAEHVTDIGRAVAQLGGKDSLIKLGKRVIALENDNIKLATTTAMHEHEATTGDKELMSATVDVTTSIKDAEMQVKANENAHKVYDEVGASDKTKQARAEIVGSRLGEFNKDAQVKVDEIERKYDIEDAYNKTVAEYIQNVAVENQKEIAKRTVESGNEQAMNNLAKHAYELDPDNVDDVVKMLKEQGSEKTKQALDEAKIRYEEQAQRDKAIADAKKAETEKAKQAQVEAEKAQAKAQSEAKNNAQKETKTQTVETKNQRTPDVSINVPQRQFGLGFTSNGINIIKSISTKEFKQKTIAEKQEMFKQLNVKERAQAIGELVETTDASSLKNMMFTSFKSEILSYLVKHSSPKNNQKLRYVERFITPADRKKIDKMQEEYAKTKGLNDINQ